jgi:hypothetical protein
VRSGTVFWLVAGGVDLFGVGLVTLAVLKWNEAGTVETWPTSSGTILSSEIQSGSSGGSSRPAMFSPEVRYSFEANGVRYEGNRVSPGTIASSSDRSDAQEVVAKYPTGQKVEVRYNPDDPSEAYLEAGAGPLPAILLSIGLVAIGVSGFMIVARKLMTRRGRSA